MKIVENIAPSMEVSGTLILSGYYSFGPFATPEKDLNTDSYLLDLSSGEKIVFAQKGESPSINFNVSPDRKWLAYTSLKSDLVITTAKWKEYARIPLEENWAFSGWLNNDKLMIRNNISKSTIDKQRGYAGKFSLILLSPFTGRRKEISPDFPAIWSPDPCWLTGCLLCDPTITRLLYPDMGSEQPFVLWNLLTGEEITRLPYGAMPMWSPDGEQLAMVREVMLGVEFYITSRDGVMTRLTQMIAYYPHVSVVSYSWSPDSRYIAFWMVRERGLPYHLALVDTKNGQITEYSIQADFEKGASFPDYLLLTNSIAPIWSPNGKQLLVDALDPERNRRLVVIVDIEKGYAAKVVENMIPIGWMASP